jgi:nucleoid DNA-binding protein
MALPLVTQGELVTRLAEETGFPKSACRHFLQSLADVTADAIQDCERVRIGNLVQIEPKVKKAQKARMGRNPQSGEKVAIPKKPADVRVAARVLKGGTDAAPTLNTLRARLRK